MIIIAVVIILIIYNMVVYKKTNRIKLSKSILIALLFSILINIQLAVNYLIPIEKYDGIGIANKVSYWLIGDEGWSTKLFEDFFYKSTIISFILLFLYLIFLIIEEFVYSKK